MEIWFRILIGIAAAIMGAAAFSKTTPWDWYPYSTFDGWPTQNLRDFCVLMVSYVLLCIVKQGKRSFAFDGLVFFLTFALWATSFVIAIHNPENQGATDWLSLLAVIFAIAFAVLAPVWKSDTYFIWQREISATTNE